MRVKVLQRVVEEVVVNVQGRLSWIVRLACGHSYEIADGYHSPVVCGRWCFSCERVRDSMLNFGPPREGA